MKIYISSFVVLIFIASCIPPGKLSEALDANSLLSSKYDTLKNKLNDTVANFSNKLGVLKTSLNSLNDRVHWFFVLKNLLNF